MNVDLRAFLAWLVLWLGTTGMAVAASVVAVNPFDLPPGATVVLELEVTLDNPLPPGTTMVCNQATINQESFSGASLAGTPSDDPDTMTPLDTTCTLILVQADLAISKADTADPVDAAGPLAYTLQVTNNGPDTATSVTVSDTLPTGVAFGSASGTGWSCGESLGVVTCTRASLALGMAPLITINLTAPAEGGDLSNTASVSAAESDPVSGNNSDSETTTVTAKADLTIDKADSVDPVDVEASFSYTLQVTNNGPSTATSVSVSDTLPAGVGFTSASGTGWTCNESLGVVTCTRPSLAVGAAPLITIMVTAPSEGGVLSNMASVTATEDDPATGNNSDSETTTVTAKADLELTKADSADPVDAAASFSYTLQVTNHGPSTATSVSVSDTLPSGVGFSSASGTGWTCNESLGVVTCTRPSLAEGAAPLVTITVTAPSEGGDISNTASVSAAEDDPVPGNNSDSESTTVTAQADLELTKTVPPGTVSVGATVTYTVTVTNNGPSTATNVVVTDNLPTGLVFQMTAGDCAEGAAAVPTCSLGSLGSGASKQYTIETTIDVMPPMSIVNSASVTADENDPNAGNNEDEADLTADGDAPTVVTVRTGPALETLQACVSTRYPVRQVAVVFSEAMRAGTGPLDPDDADNPANYVLVAAGDDGDFSTDFCGAVLGDDEPIAIDSALYAASTPVPAQSTVTLGLDGGAMLERGLYRLIACGSTTLQDLAGNALDGGVDHVVDFRVDTYNLFANGHFDCDLPPWNVLPPGLIVHDALTDADGSPLSGVANLPPSSAAAYTLRQCVNFGAFSPQESSPYQVGGRLSVTAAPTVPIRIYTHCKLYTGPSCTGSLVKHRASPPELLNGGDGSWQDLPVLSFTRSPGAASARCGFVLEKAAADALTADFDQLFWRPTIVIFADGFESGDVSQWTQVKP